MDREGKILRVGAAAILCAVLLRLAGSTLPDMKRAELVELLIFLQTGRQVEISELPAATEATDPPETLPPTVPAETQPAPSLLILGAEDGKRVTLSDHTDSQIDVLSLLQKSKKWQWLNH